MNERSLVARAAVALLLTAGFYLLALSIAAGLLIGVYLEFAYADTVLMKPTILAVVAALVIVWSILPRFDRFIAPGPQLSANEHPALFALLGDVASATSTPGSRSAEESPASVRAV